MPYANPAVNQLAYTDVDPDQWPSTITQTQTYDYSSDVDGDATVTTTGSATFTWQRVTLADKLKFPGACYNGAIWQQPDLDTQPDEFGNPPTADPTPPSDQVCVLRGEFLAVRCAIGQMPGWLVFFGGQVVQNNAFTTTVTIPNASPPEPDAVSYQDAIATIGLTCGSVAPGRGIFISGYLGQSADPYLICQQTGIGINGSAPAGAAPNEDDGADNVAFVVELIQPAIAATGQSVAVYPVYRVTFPEDARFFSNYSYYLFNGAKCFIRGADAEPQTYIDGLMAGWFNKAGFVYQRAINVYDVQMRNLSDVLSAGQISWGGVQFPGTSSIYLQGSYQELDDPFDLAGKSFEYGPDTTGLTVSVQF